MGVLFGVGVLVYQFSVGVLLCPEVWVGTRHCGPLTP